MEPTRWQAWGRYVVTALAAAAIAVFAFVLRSPVPVFDWIDLGVHELGHMIVMSGPRMLHFLAGSLLQVLVPAGLAVYFFWKQRDLAGAGFCTAWAGTSAWDVSVYIADAPVQALPLVGGGTHDWAYLLGPRGWDVMDRAGEIAGFVDLLGMVAAVGGIGMALWPAVGHLRARRRKAMPVAAAPATDLPVRDPVPYPGGAEAEQRTAVAASSPAHESDGADPWLAASRLPFFAGNPDDPAT